MYKMVGDTVEQVWNFEEWAKYYFGNRNILKTQKDDIIVSTVFLGIDHNYMLAPEHILFETMAFTKVMEDIQVRYATKKEAIDGHWKVVHQVEEMLNIKLYERPIKIKQPPINVRLR
jgi:hypothetical protein